MTAILRTCKEHGVPCGHPHVDTSNADRLVEEGYRYLMTVPTRSYAGLDTCMKLAGRV
jgi:4-hydroxy-2-oxoheptanedioate aldolase